MRSELRKVVVATYAHPELYPPVLAAIELLAKQADSIVVITRKMLVSKWLYPDNVRLIYANDEDYQGFEIEKITLKKKISHFIQFVKKIQSSTVNQKSCILMVHDVIPLFAAFLLRSKLSKNGTKIWYHNHDVTDTGKSGRFSLMGIAARFERKAFDVVDIFTLPAEERLKYFPINKLSTPPIVLPNYPLQSFYVKRVSQNVGTSLKMVYQGSIGAGHGLENIIKLLKENVGHKNLELHLVGKIRPSYLKALNNLAENEGVSGQFFYHGMKSITELPEFLQRFHVGLAIHRPYNVTYSTGGSASNKIYEYAACSLPVILFDNSHYREYLDHLNWTYFTDLTTSSLKKVLHDILMTYDNSAESARHDFESEFNYEIMFNLKNQLEKLLM